MKFKDIIITEEEVIQSLKDAGIEFCDGPTLKEQIDSIEKRLHMIDELYAIVTELDEREFAHQSIIYELRDVNWNELCDRGIELLKQLKGE